MSASSANQTEPESNESALAAFGGWSTVFGTLTDGEDLTRGQAEAAMTEILSGQASQVQIASMLIGLRSKGETAE